MRQIEKWKQRGGAKQRNESNATAIARLVQRQLQLTPPSLPQALTVRSIRVEEGVEEALFDDLEPDQGYVVNPTGVAEGDVLIAVPGEEGRPPAWTPADPVDLVPLSDGNPPSSSPTPVVTGGPRWLAVNWDGVANADPVEYEVHLSTSSGFTPDSSTLAAEIRGTLVFLRLEPDGTPLEYDTPYYVKLIAKDVDGSAAAGDQATDSLDPNAADDIVAGSITAEHLEAVMILSSVIKTASSGRRVEISEDGICLYDSDGTTKLVHIPTDSLETVMFRGLLEARGLFLSVASAHVQDDRSVKWSSLGRDGDDEYGRIQTFLSSGPVAINGEWVTEYAGLFSGGVKFNTRETSDGAEAYAKVAVQGSEETLLNESDESTFVRIPTEGIWRLEWVSASVNLPSTAAHSGGTINVTIPGLAVGDLCIYIGEASAGGSARAFHKYTDPVCTSADTITMNYYNADSSVGDPGAKTFYFLIIHHS